MKDARGENVCISNEASRLSQGKESMLKRPIQFQAAANNHA